MTTINQVRKAVNTDTIFTQKENVMGFELCILNKQAFGIWYLQIIKGGEVLQVVKLTEEQALVMINNGVSHQG